jgi:FkbM family methyltransferase
MIERITNNRFISHKEKFYHDKSGKDLYFFHWNRQFDQSDLLSSQYYEPKFKIFYDRWENIIKPNSICIDIGAGDGDTTIPISLLNKNGTVYTFEPSPAFDQVLIPNLKVNQCSNIIARKVAIMESKSLYEFNYCVGMTNGGPKKYTSQFNISSDGKDGYPESYILPGINFLDEYRNQIDKNISFIKTDCEGYDIEILETLSPLIFEHKPILQVEWFGLSHQNIVNFAKKYNYLFIDIDTQQETDPYQYKKLDVFLFPKN